MQNGLPSLQGKILSTAVLEFGNVTKCNQKLKDTLQTLRMTYHNGHRALALHFAVTFSTCGDMSDIVLLRSMLRLPVTANVVPSSPILITLMMEAIRFSKKSVLTRSTRRHIPGNGMLHSHRRENLKSYMSVLLQSRPVGVQERNCRCDGAVETACESTSLNYLYLRLTKPP
jgi:hypothetical protein